MVVVIIVALVILTASAGAVFKPGPWYEGLTKPGWTPPNRAFPIVWTLLYIAIAISGWLVWREAGFGVVLVLWGIQLVLNAAWSALFFGQHRMDLGFADICALLAVICLYTSRWPFRPRPRRRCCSCPMPPGSRRLWRSTGRSGG